MPRCIPSDYAKDETKLSHYIYWCIFRSAVYFFDAYLFCLTNASTSKKAHQRMKWMCNVFNLNKWEELNKWTTDKFHCWFLMEPKYWEHLPTNKLWLLLFKISWKLPFFTDLNHGLKINQIQVNAFNLREIY